MIPLKKNPGFSKRSSSSSLLGFFILCSFAGEGSSRVGSSLGNAPQWPAGRYGLPKPMTGCPKASGFRWDEGFIYQDLENDNSLTAKSPQFHIQGWVAGDVVRYFCIKNNASNAVDGHRFYWPAGQYCIYKKGSFCPAGLSEGWVLWDDENVNNMNSKAGVLPAGTFKSDTKIRFCCQTVGSSDDPIVLPIDSPFYLIAFNKKQCQEVLKTVHTMEYIQYDTENTYNHDGYMSPYPFGADLHEPKIYYCYYKACRWTKTALTGSFSSPDYPRTYKNKAWCEWYINVPINYTISVTFNDFRLEDFDMCKTKECACDYVEVHDTFTNGTSVLIGTYCMGIKYPYNAINSSSNHVTVVFRSDYTIGAPGFKASYQAIQVIAQPNSGILTLPTKTTQERTSTALSTVPTTKPLTTSKITTTAKGTTTSTTTSPSTSKDTSTTTATTLTSQPTTNANKTTTTGSTAAVTTSKAPSTTTSTKTTTTDSTAPVTATSNNKSTTATVVATTRETSSTTNTDTNNTIEVTTPSTNTSSITSPFTATSRPRFTTKETTESVPTSGEHISVKPSEKGSNATSGEGIHEASNENAASGGEMVTIAVVAALFLIGGGLAGTSICLWKKHQFRRRQLKKERLTVSFTSSEKSFGCSNVLLDMYGDGEGRVNEPRYVEVKLESQNVLYDTGDCGQFTAHKEDFDDEIKETENPLYASSVETVQENDNPLYESLEDCVIKPTFEVDNPIYDRLI